MQEMRDEVKAEEQQIAQERESSEARLEPVAGLKRRVRELFSTLPSTVTLEHRATVREALDVMRENQLSCVLVVEQEQLVGIFTERDVMRPKPECLGLDDTFADALHQMAVGDYRHMPVVDERGRPMALLSMQVTVDRSWPRCRRSCSTALRPRRIVTRWHPLGKARKPPAQLLGIEEVVTRPKRDTSDEDGRSLRAVTSV
jgi:CBS domain-containing protein